MSIPNPPADEPAPAGWYPDADGGQRYWDGQSWLNIPAPDSTVQAAAPRRVKPKHLRLWAAVIAAVLLLGGGTVAITTKIQSDQHQAAAAAAAKAKAEAKADAEAAAAAERERQEAADRSERENRAAAVSEIEASVKTMAQKHAKDGVIDGPVIKVTCDPVDGGSTDDLTQKTTVFQCFVANKDNKDGTMSGYYYNATMNWDTSEFTYGFGQP